MPSPVGHALGGFAIGWLAARSARLDRPIVAALGFAALGAVPDVDVLVEGTHRLYTHSVAAVALVAGLSAAALAAGKGLHWRLVLACTAAYASHLLLDWMGDDRSIPIGIRALWPFTDAYFQSDLRWFPSVERRYWLPGFWTANLHAIAWELAILSPLVVLALALRRHAAAPRPQDQQRRQY